MKKSELKQIIKECIKEVNDAEDYDDTTEVWRKIVDKDSQKLSSEDEKFLNKEDELTKWEIHYNAGFRDARAGKPKMINPTEEYVNGYRDGLKSKNQRS